MPARVCEKDGVFVVDLVGEIRLSDDFTPSLQRQVTELLDEGKPDILLNFAKVDFIDSYGIGDIVAAYLAIKEKKGRLKLCCLSPKIWLIFHYSGLTRILEIFDTEGKALKSFA
ncbi:MAG: spoIIAA1 [Candidatus Aminicenantes bacterium]|jgi:anti-anti-sigma factor|nr:spoIIAA1 [Candidatus Aminicenantes bacterium]